MFLCVPVLFRILYIVRLVMLRRDYYRIQPPVVKTVETSQGPTNLRCLAEILFTYNSMVTARHDKIRRPLPPSPSPKGKERHYISISQPQIFHFNNRIIPNNENISNKLALCGDGPASSGIGIGFTHQSFHSQFSISPPL